MARVAVVGGGIRGIGAAYFLRRDGHEVTVIEAAPFLGGILRGTAWNGFHLDKGCHLFSNRDLSLTEAILEIMDNQVLPVDFRYASVTAGHLTEGFAIPDLSVLGPKVCSQILFEMVTGACEAHDPPKTLHDGLVQRFGQTAARHLEGPAVKALACRPQEADISTLRTANFGRIKLLPEAPSALLKQVPAFDERLACTSQEDPFRFVKEARPDMASRHYYPAHKGTTGFCEAAERYLAAARVALRLGVRIQSMSTDGGGVACRFSDGSEAHFDRLVWTVEPGLLAKVLLGTDPLEPYLHKVPLILYYFAVPEAKLGPYTYLHDYTPEHLVFRMSTPGRYGRQVKADGTTFMCCEVTTALDAPIWSDPEGHAEKVWREVVARGAAAECTPSDLHILKTPVSFPVGKPGHAAEAQALKDRLSGFGAQILVDAGGAFYKNEILTDIRRLVAA